MIRVIRETWPAILLLVVMATFLVAVGLAAVADRAQ